MDANGRFYINVPLLAGANDLVATVTMANGQTLSQTITVTSDGVASDVRIDATPLQGPAPLTTTFTVTNDAATTVTVQVNGSTSGTVPAGQSASFNITLGTAASFPVTVNATDAQNNATTRNFVLVAADPDQMDQMFKALWGGMTDALVGGDKAAALSYLSSSAQLKYGPVFDALAPDFAQILPTWSLPLKGSISSVVGEYGVVTPNGSDRGLFLIYFVRGTDGVWRLDSM